MEDEELKRILKEKYFDDGDYIEIYELLKSDDENSFLYCSGLDFREDVLNEFIASMSLAAKWFIKGLVKDV